MIYDATRSALMVGLVGVVQFAPQPILGPTSGRWVDTGNTARQILLSRVLRVAGAGSMAAQLFIEPGLQGISAATPLPALRSRQHPRSTGSTS